MYGVYYNFSSLMRNLLTFEWETPKEMTLHMLILCIISIFCFSINEFLSGRWSADFFTFIRSQLISGINVNYSDF